MIFRLTNKAFFALVLIGILPWIFLASKQVGSSPEFFTQTEQPLVTLRLSPSFGGFSVGEEVTLAILLENINGRAIDGVDVKLRFDPQKLQVAEVVPNQKDFMAFPAQKVDVDKGLIMISALASWDDPLVGRKGSVEIAELRLLPLARGEVGLAFDFAPGLTFDSNVAQHQTNLDMLGEVEGGRYQIEE